MAFHHESSFFRYFWNHAMIEFIHLVRFAGSMMPWFSPSTSIKAVGTPNILRALYICIDSPIGTLVSAVPWVKRSPLLTKAWCSRRVYYESDIAQSIPIVSRIVGAITEATRCWRALIVAVIANQSAAKDIFFIFFVLLLYKNRNWHKHANSLYTQYDYYVWLFFKRTL